jgi:hypothetical protein
MFRKTFLALPVVATLLLAAAPALAHEQQTFRIGGKEYTFVIGSLNEPIFVDDKSGVDLRVTKAGGKPAKGAVAHDDGDGDHEEAGTPVTGLETTLKVELSAGDKKRVMDLSPVYGAVGAYKTTYYPTVATTISYRVFGDLEGNPIDLTFTCNPAGHAKAPEDKTETKITETVTRIHKTGAFGCPESKADAGFPEPAASLRELSTRTGTAAPTSPQNENLPLGLSAIGIVLGTAALMRKK